MKLGEKKNRRRRGNCRCSNIFAWIIRDFKCRFRKRNFKKVNKNKHRQYKIIDGVNTRVKEYGEE